MRENRIGRKSKVSDGRSVRVGLAGPKPRLKSVGDGQQANIPVLAVGDVRTFWESSASEWIEVVSG